MKTSKTEKLSVHRSLSVIAADIISTWPRPYFGAVPYLEAMQALDTVADNYFLDTGRSVVAYFLANAATWRGPDARRIKAELKGLLR